MIKKILIAIIIAIILIIGIFLITKQRKANKFTFPKEVIVINNSGYKNIDTMAMVLLNKMMDIDTIQLNIYYIRYGLFDYGDTRLLAYVERNPFEKHEYNLYMARDIGDISIESIISHECIHINQMEKGELIQSILFENYAIYKKDTIFYLNTPYELRPFEQDAFNIEKSVTNKLYKMLYN